MSFSHMDAGTNMRIVCVWNCVGYMCVPGKFTLKNEKKHRSKKLSARVQQTKYETNHALMFS